MENIIAEGTQKTPTLNFNASTGIIDIEGRSIPENSVEYYKPLLEWLDQYAQQPQQKTVVNMKFEYFNTSSSKCILYFMKKIEIIAKSGSDTVINWYFEKDDEDMQEAGEDYQAIIKVPFQMIPFED